MNKEREKKQNKTKKVIRMDDIGIERTWRKRGKGKIREQAEVAEGGRQQSST
jgi:hypothetical protein